MAKQPPMLSEHGQFHTTKRTVFWTALLAPLAFIPWFADGYNLPKMALFCCGTAVSWIVAIREYPFLSGIRSKFSHLDIVLLSWLALYSIATVFSVNIWQSVWGQYRFHSFGLITAVAGYAFYFLLKTTGTVESAKKGFLTAGGIIALIALIEFATGNRDRINSLSGSPIYYSGFLVPLTPIVLGNYLKTKKVIYSILFCTYLAALAVSMARGSWLAVAVALLILGSYAFLKKNSMKQLLIAAVAVLAIASSALLFTPAVSKVVTITKSEYTSNVSRIEGWKSALSAIKSRPLTGYGPDNFIFAFRNHKTEKYFKSIGKNMAQAHAHNDFLQMAATAGIPCAVLFIIAWFMIMSRAAKRSTKNIDNYSILSALSGLFIYLQFNNGMVGTLMLFWFLAASTEPYVVPEKKITDNKRRFSSIITFLAAIMIGISLMPLAGEALFTKATQLAMHGGALDAIKTFEKSYTLSPYVNDYYQASQDTASVYARSVADPEQKKKLLEQAVEIAKLNTRRNAANPDTWYNLASMLVAHYQLTAQDTRTAAANAIVESMRRDPYNVDALAGLAKISVLLGRRDQAENLWKGVRNLDPTNREAEYYLQ